MATAMDAVCQEISGCILCPVVCLEIVELCLFFLVLFVVVGGTFFAIHVHGSPDFSELRKERFCCWKRASFMLGSVCSLVKLVTVIPLLKMASLAENNRLRHYPPFSLFFFFMNWKMKQWCHNFSKIITSENKCNTDDTFQT